MKIASNAFFIAVFFMFGSYVLAQDLKGLLPIKSTCKDVKKIFNTANCKKVENIFETGGEKIHIVYSTKNCQTFFGYRWNVPIGTVIIISHYFNRNIKEVTLEDLGVKLKEEDYNKNLTDVKSFIIYERKTGGHSVSIIDGLIDNILYTPTLQDAEIKGCKK